VRGIHCGLVRHERAYTIDMAKPNYAFAKRQRDLLKQQKKEEKRRRKAAGQQAAPAEPDGQPGEQATAEPGAAGGDLPRPGGVERG